ncbi:retrovirus-related pol polyprotein from transposon TNT 1-94 [Tanacetum coccineum]
MRQYICHTDHNLWDIIVNGDLEDEATPSGEQSSPPFHNVPDAKSLWAAIKSRFGGNEESKKMQKNVLKHQFENFVTASNETLDKAYDRIRNSKSTWQNHGAYALIHEINQIFDEGLNIDDLYNNLRVYEDELKRSLGSNSASQNLAFLSSKNTISTNEVSTASGDIGVSTAGGINQVPSTPTEDGDKLRGIGIFDGRLAMLTYIVKKFSFKGQEKYGLQRKRLNYDTEREKHNKAKLEIRGYEIALESLEARILRHEKNELAWGKRYEFQNYDLKWSSKNLTKILNSQMSDHDKNGLGFGTQMNNLSNKSETDSENNLTIFEVKSSDEESTLANNRFTKANKYHAVPSPITRNPLTPRANISFAGLDEYAFRNKIIESKTTETNKTVGTTNEASIVKPKSVNETVVSKSKIIRDGVIIEDWTSDDEDDVCANKTVSSVKPNVTQVVRSQADKSSQTSQNKGLVLRKVKNVVNTGERVVKPVWDYGKRVNHQNFSKNLKYHHAKRTFNPSAVLTRAGLVNTDRSNVSTARSICTIRPVYTVRLVSTARPLVSKIAQSNSVIRPNHPRLDIVRPKASNSPIKRSYFTQPVYRPKDLKPDVKTFGIKNMTTVGTRAVVSKGKVENVLKKDKWVWRPKMNYQDHVYKYNGSYMLKKIEYGNPEILLQDHAVVDSGCSSHMTGNKAYLSDYEDLNGGFVAFGSDPKGGKITCKGKIKTANLDFDDVFFGDKLTLSFLMKGQLVLRAPRKMFKNYVGAKKGIKREFSVARTPQQNGVVERKNRTLIEAARTMLEDSLLPIPFLAEAVNTACYVLNRVLVTKPQNKTEISKFDGKSDEGYLLGYSTSSKAFRVYNKRTKRVEENLHINFLKDQPNVAGTGTQDSYVAGSSGKDKGPTQEYILLPLQPHRTRIPIKDIVQDVQEQPSKNASPDKGIQVSEDVFDKEGQHQMPEDEQVWQDELEMMITQEVVANALNDASRQAFEEEKRKIASQKKTAQATSTNQLSTDRPFVSTNRSFVSTDRSNTPNVSAASTSTCAHADESSFVYLGGKIPIDASTLPNADLPIDPNMSDLEDAYDTLPNDGIFNGAYDDDEDVGAVADFNNMDNTIAVSPIPTLRIHKDHPKGQILRDPTLAVQTRGKIQKASSA